MSDEPSHTRKVRIDQLLKASDINFAPCIRESISDSQCVKDETKTGHDFLQTFIWIHSADDATRY